MAVALNGFSLTDAKELMKMLEKFTSSNGATAPVSEAVVQTVTPTETPACGFCGNEGRLIPAGTSRAGRPYAAFWGCSQYRDSGCKGDFPNVAVPKTEAPAPASAVDVDDIEIDSDLMPF